MPDGSATEGLVYDLLADAGFDWHVHDEHQLTCAERGVLLVDAGDETWALLQSRAMDPRRGSPLRRRGLPGEDAELVVTPKRCPLTRTVPTLVAADGLVSQLVVHLLAVGLTRPGVSWPSPCCGTCSTRWP